uniref:Solute carrier family 15 member 1 n=1 Tax=Podarcis muralis TaxID=64176 RepID=A0A670KGR4_PODMU
MGPGCFGYPLSIFFIVINEFCERFSYYGMRAVLVLYFKYFLNWSDNLATAIYHTFVALCYLTPILGALVADSWLGKFKTIISLSIVYTIGQAVLSVGSIHDLLDQDGDGRVDNVAIPIAFSMVGLILIAFGTGGIKPCVAAFGGDQFEDHQEKQRNRFFSIFYLSINAGSLLSTIITPILRGVECGIHVKQKCYPLAFGVPAILMAVALLVFIVGSTMYKKVQPQGNVMVRVAKCITFSIGNRFRHRSKQYPKREHWLDWASEKYDKRLIAQTKMVLRVLFLYIPLPMFWALFDQQGSRWTLQATTMDGDFVIINFLVFSPLSSQQTVNPILIVIMVPVVDAVVYPLIKKCHINFTPLRKMTVGMLLAALAFVVAAVVQVQIDLFVFIFTTEAKNRGLILNYSHFTSSVSVYAVIKVIFNLCCLFKMQGFVWINIIWFSFQCNSSEVLLNYVEDIQPNTISMAWQIPQYFIITCAEVVFSVTGLSFSYDQAPANMKSVLQAGWLLTVAVGNIIVLIIAGASKIEEQWVEYVLFAALLVAVTLVFAIMAYFYTYVDPVEVEAQMVEDEKKREKEPPSYENGNAPVLQTQM